ncbi:MAG: hypothetical protein ACTSRI_05885 [Promethearchaeota archaeon]
MMKPEKRDWIVRMTDLFIKSKVNILFNAPSVRNFLRKECNDSISIPTTEKLLLAIIEAQKSGLIFKIKDKRRKLIEKETANNEKWYELIEY